MDDNGTAAAESALCDALPDGVVIADGSGTVVLVNAVARAMLGDRARVGAPLSSAITVQDQDGADWFACVQPLRDFRIRTGIPEQSWLLPDGTEVLITTRITWNEERSAIEQVGLVLRSGRGRARLDRDRSDLVATVAHELRSPLTGVKGFVTTLLRKWDRLNDDQKKLMLHTVATDAERLSRLITELLDVARIDTGRLPLYPREVDLVPILDRIVASVGAGTSRPIVVTTPEHAWAFADPDKFVQVATNLIDNAIRHGEGEVRVTTEPGPLGVRITVDDQGEGIPDELRVRVFTKFWKHGARGGSGLGMYIVNGLVRAHGGELAIQDAPGGGARIVLDWPERDRRS